MALSLRALSLYISMATFRPPAPQPTARKASKLPRWAPINNAPSPSSSAAAHRLHAMHLDIEIVEPVIEQVNAVVNGAGKTQHMAVAIAPARVAAPAPAPGNGGSRGAPWVQTSTK